jgi:KTSC domain
MPVWRKLDGMKINTPEGIVTLNARLVNSSNVDIVGWPVTGEPMMYVQFGGGGRYAYYPVSRQQVVAAANAPSVGKYINERIKPMKKAVKIR